MEAFAVMLLRKSLIANDFLIGVVFTTYFYNVHVHYKMCVIVYICWRNEPKISIVVLDKRWFVFIIGGFVMNSLFD